MTVEVDPLPELGPLAAFRVRSDRTAPRVVFLHGFTQNSYCLGPFAESVSRCADLFAVDLPGHGGSRSFGSADLWTCADLVAATAGRADYIGYSMGGRVALHLAIRHPEAVRSLVLIGATAGIVDPAERSERAAADGRTAHRIEEIGTARFVEEWLAQPLFESLPSDVRFVAERSVNDPLSLAASLRHAGTGAMEPLWDDLADITCPVLVISGADDAKFTAIGSRLVDAIGTNATAAVVSGSGHSVHLEQPELCAELITDFLRSASDQKSD